MSDQHLKLHSSGHLALHSSGHLRLIGTPISSTHVTKPVSGLSTGSGTWASVANQTLANMNVGWTWGANSLGAAFGTELKGFLSPTKYVGCQYYGLLYTLGPSSGYLSCGFSTTGSGMIYVGTGASAPSNDVRTWTAGVFAGASGSIDGAAVLKYVWFYADLTTWIPPESEFQYIKKFTLTDLSFTA